MRFHVWCDDCGYRKVVLTGRIAEIVRLGHMTKHPHVYSYEWPRLRNPKKARLAILHVRARRGEQPSNETTQNFIRSIKA